MDSNGNEQGVTRIIKKCILEWLEIAFGIEEEEEPIPPTWEEFWALVVVWLQAEQDQDGVPLHGLLHTHKNIVKLATVVHGDPDHRSFVDMLRQEGGGRVFAYKRIKMEMAQWYFERTGRVPAGYRLTVEQRQRYLEGFNKRQRVGIEYVREKNLIKGIDIIRI
jgi:hypothetical protein